MNNVVLLEMLKKKSKTPSNRGQYQIILHNDSKNTYDHVIDTLMEGCGYNEIQATQCALITHNAKKCVIYQDTFDSCKPVYEFLNNNGLTVTIKKYVKNN